MQREPHPPSGHDPRLDPRHDPRQGAGQEPLEEDAEASTWVTRLGTVVGGGVLAAAASSLPAELRIGDGGSIIRAIEQWLALAALLTPLAILLVAVLRRGRGGSTDPRRSSRAALRRGRAVVGSARARCPLGVRRGAAREDAPPWPRGRDVRDPRARLRVSSSRCSRCTACACSCECRRPVIASR